MKDKKDLLGGLIIVVLLILVLVTYIICYNYKKEEDKEIELEDNSLAVINIFDDYSTLKVINKDEKLNKNIIGTYNCKDDSCDIYFSDNIQKSCYDDYVILKENNKIFIYNYVLNEVVTNLYDDIEYKLENNNYIIKNNNKYGIINEKGEEILSPTYEKIDYINIKDGLAITENDDLYGLVNVEVGNVIIENKYEYIRIDDQKYYSILKEGLWYVIDDNDNIITNGYRYTFAFNKGFVALIDNSLQILKYNSQTNERLNEKTITIFKDDGYKLNRSGSNIYIEVDNEDNILKYTYNINRNNLTNK